MPADVAETAVVASAKEGRTSYDSTMAQFEAEAASREVEAEQAAPATNGMDLMSMLNSITSQVETMSKEASERTEVLNTSVTRQRRKSRELEQSVFGMHLTDVHKLHEVFDEIDTDKSGSIDVEGAHHGRDRTTLVLNQHLSDGRASPLRCVHLV